MAVSSPWPRVHRDRPALMGAALPVVALDRIQSGVGALSLTAACPGSVGDLRLGCAYQLASGQPSIVQLDGDLKLAPPRAARPVIAAHRDQFETLRIDLRQSRQVERLIVVVYSPSDAVLSWGGRILVETFGRARAEIDLARPAARGVLVALSLYNIDGELVIRAERELVDGPLRAACAAYGFDRISWLDDRTPLA